MRKEPNNYSQLISICLLVCSNFLQQQNKAKEKEKKKKNKKKAKMSSNKRKVEDEQPLGSKKQATSRLVSLASSDSNSLAQERVEIPSEADNEEKEDEECKEEEEGVPTLLPLNQFEVLSSDHISAKTLTIFQTNRGIQDLARRYQQLPTSNNLERNELHDQIISRLRKLLRQYTFSSSCYSCSIVSFEFFFLTLRGKLLDKYKV